MKKSNAYKDIKRLMMVRWLHLALTASSAPFLTGACITKMMTSGASPSIMPALIVFPTMSLAISVVVCLAYTKAIGKHPLFSCWQSAVFHFLAAVFLLAPVSTIEENARNTYGFFSGVAISAGLFALCIALFAEWPIARRTRLRKHFAELLVDEREMRAVVAQRHGGACTYRESAMPKLTAEEAEALARLTAKRLRIVRTLVRIGEIEDASEADAWDMEKETPRHTAAMNAGAS